MDYPDYDPALDSPPLADDELETLDDLLRALPGDAAMNIEAMDGYLTALLVGPPSLKALPSARWMPAIWGGDGTGAAPFQSQKQKKRAIVMVLRHLHAIDRQLAEGPEAWEPVVSVAEQGEQELVDAEDWCAGFLHAVALDAPAWNTMFDDATLGPLLVPIALLGGEEGELGDEDRARLADPQARDAISRAAIEAVPALRYRG